MPAGFHRHLVGKNSWEIFATVISLEIRYVAKLVIIQTFYQPTDWILFKWHDKSSALNYTHYAMLYPQNGGRIVAIDVTSPNVHLNRSVPRLCCKSACRWLTAAHSNSTEITDGCGVGHRDMWQLLCLRRTQAISADTVIAYITLDDRPNITSAWCRYAA